MPDVTVPAHLPEAVRHLGRVHHVAVIVRDIEDSLRLWRDVLGLPVELVLPIEADRVTIAFLRVGESKIELVQPTDDTTGVARFLASKGEGFHHICFEVGNLSETLLRLEVDGIELIDSAPRKGAEGPVAFLHPRSCHGVLVELIEAPGGPSWASLRYAAVLSAPRVRRALLRAGVTRHEVTHQLGVLHRRGAEHHAARAHGENGVDFSHTCTARVERHQGAGDLFCGGCGDCHGFAAFEGGVIDRIEHSICGTWPHWEKRLARSWSIRRENNTGVGRLRLLRKRARSLRMLVFPIASDARVPDRLPKRAAHGLCPPA
jgi:methylmalonyl-CoA epimerase